MTKIILGANSLNDVSTEELCNKLLQQTEEGKDFEIKIKNLVSRDISLPQENLFLLSDTYEDEPKKLKLNKDSFISLVSSIEQIAFLNGYNKLIAIPSAHLP